MSIPVKLFLVLDGSGKRTFAKSRIEIEILENLRKPLTLQSTRKRIDIDFKRVSFIYALARLTKIENVWFCSGGLSYAIQEKFTAWRVNSTLNSTRKTDIALIAKRFNVEFTRQAVNFSIESFDISKYFKNS